MFGSPLHEFAGTCAPRLSPSVAQLLDEAGDSLDVRYHVQWLDKVRAWRMIDSDDRYSVAHKIREHRIHDFSSERTESELEQALASLLQDIRSSSAPA